MNATKHVALLTSNIFGRGFDSRRLHQYLVYYQLVAIILRAGSYPPLSTYLGSIVFADVFLFVQSGALKSLSDP